MKRFRLLFSCLIILCLVVSSQTISYGATIDSAADLADVNEWIVEENADTVISLRTVDYPNGNACAYMIKNDEIIYSSYLDREKGQITNTDYLTGSVSVENAPESSENKIEYFNPAEISEMSNDPYYYETVGELNFTLGHYTQGELVEVTSSFNVERSINNFISKKDLAGFYAHRASFAVSVASLIGIPAAEAYPLVSTIMNILGFASDAKEFWVPEYEVETVHYIVTWHGRGFDRDTVLQGAHYTFYLPDNTPVTETTENYYAPNSFANRNTTFATELIKLYHPGFDIYTVQW